MGLIYQGLFPSLENLLKHKKEIYSTVLAAQRAVMESMKPKVSWPKMHRLADRVICENLKKYGYLQGDVDDMMKVFIGSLFMPHGLGHLLGIDTHDVGGYPSDGSIARSTEPGLKSLRLVKPLEENMVVTVEPGVYFIEPVLEAALKDEHKSKHLNAHKIRSMYGFGGIRIEDDILVLKDGIENLSRHSPTSIEEIEALLSKHGQ